MKLMFLPAITNDLQHHIVDKPTVANKWNWQPSTSAAKTN